MTYSRQTLSHDGFLSFFAQLGDQVGHLDFCLTRLGSFGRQCRSAHLMDGRGEIADGGGGKLLDGGALFVPDAGA